MWLASGARKRSTQGRCGWGTEALGRGTLGLGSSTARETGETRAEKPFETKSLVPHPRPNQMHPGPANNHSSLQAPPGFVPANTSQALSTREAQVARSPGSPWGDGSGGGRAQSGLGNPDLVTQTPTTGRHLLGSRSPREIHRLESCQPRRCELRSPGGLEPERRGLPAAGSNPGHRPLGRAAR